MRSTPSNPSTPQHHKAAVFIGRLQPFHNGHLALLRHALAIAERVVVVLGSAFQARTTKNPFTWEERAQMIALSLGEADAARVRFVPVRDYYDDAAWVQAVRAGAQQALHGERDIALVGHFKDASSYYLQSFPGWSLVSTEAHMELSATDLRNVLFDATPDTAATSAALAVLSPHMPEPALAFVRSWLQMPFIASLRAEWRQLKREKEAWASAPYAPVFVTADAVVTCAGKVLLVVRDRAPGAGLYALPGGFLEQTETVYQAAVRELREETGLALLPTYLDHAHKGGAVFDHPGRSQRGRVITHAQYFALKGDEPPAVRGMDDARTARWVPIDELVSMEAQFHDDHFSILNHFLALVSH